MKVTIRVLFVVIMVFGIIVAIKLKNKKHQNPVPPDLDPPSAVEPENKPNEEVKPPDPPPVEPKEEAPKEVKTYKEALEAAKKFNKNIFLYFGAPWCGNCVQLEKNVFSQDDVKEKLGDFIVLHVNVDMNKKLARQYKVYGIPAYFIIDGEENEIADRSGYTNKDTFLKWLDVKGKETNWSNPEGLTIIEPDP